MSAKAEIDMCLTCTRITCDTGNCLLRTAATAQRASGGSAGLASVGCAPAGRACQRQWRDCYRMMTLRRREAKALYLDGRRVTQRELARLCHKSQERISECVRRGWTGDQIVEYYGGRK